MVTMSKQESYIDTIPTLNILPSGGKRPHIHDMWDAEFGDGEGISSPLGRKCNWQEYPCIVGHSKDYALVAFSETEGKIIDVDGQTIEEGDPRTLWKVNKCGQNLDDIKWRQTFPEEHAEYLFWKSKYPELLTR